MIFCENDFCNCSGDFSSWSARYRKEEIDVKNNKTEFGSTRVSQCECFSAAYG